MGAVKLAVVLFNLGGPDGPGAVRPFLFNLFNDKAIIAAPAPLRLAIATLISTLRAKSARANYAIMGGGSPLLPGTQAQADALSAALAAARPDIEAKVFIAMRYWHPMTGQTAREVAGFAPDEIVLLPLYPQFSTTTTGSSLEAWSKAYSGSGRGRAVCCYPVAEGVVDAHAAAIRRTWDAAGRPKGLRLLFSAHGLPRSVVASGDPYQAQIEATAGAIAARLPELADWRICYQSRVGPMKWLGPTTPDEIKQAAAEGLGVLIDPIAFVSEHVETLVELDHEYAELAKQEGCAPYLRAPTLGVMRAYIDGLAQASLTALDRADALGPEGDWLCPSHHGKCPKRLALKDGLP